MFITKYSFYLIKLMFILTFQSFKTEPDDDGDYLGRNARPTVSRISRIPSSKKKKPSSAPASMNVKRFSSKKLLPVIAAAAAMTASADGSESELTSPEKKSAASLGVALRNLLKLPKAHKWVCYEFFYSNLDKVLFEGENDFMVCVRESFPLLQTRRLTRVNFYCLCKAKRMVYLRRLKPYSELPHQVRSPG